MRLISNWRDLLKKAWSLRLMALAALLSGLEFVLPYLADVFPRGAFAALSFVTVAGAFVARLVAQKGLSE